MQKKSRIKVGLIGNPNTGKSTLFNTLTGSRQRVGNWPGKTVEKKHGFFKYDDFEFELVDLPGAYSLTAYSEEEIVTSEFVFTEKPDFIIQIVDASNLERNLYLTTQLLELGIPLVLALNMRDVAQKRGIKIDSEKMSELLKIPVVNIAARKKAGIENLLVKISGELSKLENYSPQKSKYSQEIEAELDKIKNYISLKDIAKNENELNWLSIKLLEGDYKAKKSISNKDFSEELQRIVDGSIAYLESTYSKDLHTVLADYRYRFINSINSEVLEESCQEKKCSFSDKIDCLVTNKFLGLPIFALIAWLIFKITFHLSTPFMDMIDGLFGLLGEKVSVLLESWSAPEWLVSLMLDGVIGGVGGVLVFVPIIAFLFLLMAIMEDSGYMARVAYVMDKLMTKLGLHGKAFIPLILGFGCTVPGVMATRTLDNKKDRLLTILISPFMSCGARLPVYVLFAAAFFSAHQGLVILSLYLIGVAISILLGLVFKKFLFHETYSPFVIELPSYRLPSLKGLLIHTWEKVWMFIKKAGTIILAFSIFIWFFASMPVGVEYASENSLVGQAGELVAPVFEPLGFGDWKASVSLLFGLVAKEVVVGTFGALYGLSDVENEAGLVTALQNDFTPLSAYSFMVFVLLYVPCMAVIATVKKETNSWKWPLFMLFYTTAIAWLVSFIVFQAGTALGFS
jgi:ferrous iron transport protein B